MKSKAWRLLSINNYNNFVRLFNIRYTSQYWFRYNLIWFVGTVV